MKKISITDFEFKVTGYGHYNVTYTSPVTGKQWTTGIDDMPIIDATKNSENPKKKDLEYLLHLNAVVVGNIHDNPDKAPNFTIE